MPLTEEEEKAKKAINNQKNYVKRKAKFEEMRSNLQRRVNSGELTEKNMIEELLKIAVGWEKTRLQSQLKIVTLQEEVCTAGDGTAEKADAEARLAQAMRDNNEIVANYRDLCELIDEMYNVGPANSDISAAPVFPWPTECSTKAYLFLVAFIIPMSVWPPNPVDERTRKAISVFLHPDRTGPYADFIEEAQRAQLSAIWHGCGMEIDKAQAEWTKNKTKHAMFMRDWATVKEEVQAYFFPTGERVPPFVFGTIVRDAGEVTASRRNRGEEGDRPGMGATGGT